MTQAAAAFRTRHDDYLGAERFEALDGIRALAVALVVTVHSGAYPSKLLMQLDGSLGVPIFFVLSGFLITTLLLREEQRFGNVSLSAFYVRRAMRLLPVYYLTLGVYVALVALTSSPDALARRESLYARLPYFLFYLNEYAQFAEPKSEVFGHSWSLGIEEKFYLVWPALAFVALRHARHQRVPTAVVLCLAGGVAAALLPSLPVFGDAYASLLIGCVLALGMHSPAGFAWIARVTGGRVHHGILAVAVLVQCTPALHEWRRTLLYPLVIAAVLATVLIERSWWTRLLGTPAMRFVGRSSYAVYLVHVLVMHAVGRLIFRGASGELVGILHWVVVMAASLAVAAVMYRLVELPCIRYGHSLSAAIRGTPPH